MLTNMRSIFEDIMEVSNVDLSWNPGENPMPKTSTRSLDKLTLSPQEIRGCLERAIEHALRSGGRSTSSPREVGEALRAIRDKKLHREISPNFYDFCMIRYGYTPDRVDHLIAIADTPPGVPFAPSTSAPKEQPSPVIYFIQAGDLIKIGYTVDIKKRLIALRTSSPVALILLGIMPGGPKVEAELHERFASSRRHGEWFHRNARLIRFIKENTEHDRASDGFAGDEWHQARFGL